MSTSNARRRAQQLRRTRVRRGGKAGEEGASLRLVICGAIFVLLVAAKLLFPDAVGRLAESARQLIGRGFQGGVCRRRPGRQRRRAGG